MDNTDSKLPETSEKGKSSKGDPLPRSRGSSRGGNITNSLIGSFTESILHVPTPDLWPSPSKLVYGSDIYRDRQFNAKALLVNVNINTQYSSDGIQFPAVAPATIDAKVTQTTFNLIAQLYSTQARLLLNKRNIPIRDTLLDQPGVVGVTQGNAAVFLTAYTQAWMNLRGLEGMYHAGGFNQATQAAAEAIGQVWPRLAGDLARLYSFARPPKYEKLLDWLAGPKARDDNSPVYIQMSAGGVPTDITTVAGVINYLGIAEAALNSLSQLVGTSPDLQRIANLWALAYENAGRVPSRAQDISLDGAEWIAIAGMCSQYHDNTATRNFLFPNLNSPGGYIPILIPHNAKPESVYPLFTLMRGGFYSPEPLAGTLDTAIPNIVGLFGNSNLSTNGTQWAVYNQQNAFTGETNAAAGPFSVLYNDQHSLFWWMAPNMLESVDYTTDARNYYDMDVLWFNEDMILNETVWYWNDIFYSDLL